MGHIAAHEARGEILTGLLYVRAGAEDLHGHLNTVAVPLTQLAHDDLCPGSAELEKLQARFR